MNGGLRLPIMAVAREYRRSIRQYATVREMKMLWGKRRGCDTFGAVQQTDGAPHVIVGTMLVIVLEKVFFLRLPFDQLAPFELVEFMTMPAASLGCDARRNRT